MTPSPAAYAEARALLDAELRAALPPGRLAGRGGLRSGPAPLGVDGGADAQPPGASEPLLHEPVRKVGAAVSLHGVEQDALLLGAEHDVPADPIAHDDDQSAPGDAGQFCGSVGLDPSTQRVYGRPMSESTKRRTPREEGRIQLPLKTDERDLLRQAAQRAGLPTTQYIRTNMLRLARLDLGGGR